MRGHPYREWRMADWPMTELFSREDGEPKAHTHWDPPGTWNLEKLHLELKYLGKKEAEARLQQKIMIIMHNTSWLHGNARDTWGGHVTCPAYLDCLFFLGSSIEKICTVPWSLETQSSDESWLKLMLQNNQINGQPQYNKMDSLSTTRGRFYQGDLLTSRCLHC